MSVFTGLTIREAPRKLWTMDDSPIEYSLVFFPDRDVSARYSTPSDTQHLYTYEELLVQHGSLTDEEPVKKVTVVLKTMNNEGHAANAYRKYVDRTGDIAFIDSAGKSGVLSVFAGSMVVFFDGRMGRKLYKLTSEDLTWPLYYMLPEEIDGNA